MPSPYPQTVEEAAGLLDGWAMYAAGKHLDTIDAARISAVRDALRTGLPAHEAAIRDAARAEERERCAEVAASHASIWPVAGNAIAAAIRRPVVYCRDCKHFGGSECTSVYEEGGCTAFEVKPIPPAATEPVRDCSTCRHMPPGCRRNTDGACLGERWCKGRPGPFAYRLWQSVEVTHDDLAALSAALDAGATRLRPPAATEAGTGTDTGGLRRIGWTQEMIDAEEFDCPDCDCDAAPGEECKDGCAGCAPDKTLDGKTYCTCGDEIRPGHASWLLQCENCLMSLEDDGSILAPYLPTPPAATEAGADDTIAAGYDQSWRPGAQPPPDAGGRRDPCVECGTDCPGAGDAEYDDGGPCHRFTRREGGEP
jgi:hypothetical protein